MSLQDIRAEINEIESAEDKLYQYVEMSNRYLRNAPDSMLLVSDEIRNLKGIEEQKKEAFSLFIAASAWRLLDSDSALYYRRRASEKLRKLNEHNSYLMVENLRATQLTLQRDYIQAESLYFNAISYRENLEEEVEYPVHYFYGNLGNLYVNVGAHDLAIDMFEKFLEYEDNPQDRCNILSKISTSFTELGDFEKSIEILSPCLEYENLAPPIKAIVRGNLGRNYEMKGDSLRALALFEDAASITTRYRIPNIGSGNLIRLGHRYMEMGKLQKADSVGQLLNGDPSNFMRPNERILQKMIGLRSLKNVSVLPQMPSTVKKLNMNLI
ncbi:tetratricopeptide repeat protein [Gracilimonas halophila]|uniref:Tetratricopeptide repeat-containing protein n=1 Tax=Gracilimonas halophila TaxID=1834464 RepID=A0ABW5JI56_9BACT